MKPLLAMPWSLTRRGILGINQRNAALILPLNERRHFQSVDSKLATKRLAETAGVPTPALLGLIQRPRELFRIAEAAHQGAFVIKPNRGSGGKGVLVIKGVTRFGNSIRRYLKASGLEIEETELRGHVTNILGGLFSLGGRRDVALLEECITSHPDLADLSYRGAPDLRIVIYRGYPAMAMLRIATRRSDGRANLHQGAIGLGLDLGSGTVHHACCGTFPLRVHPDTGESLLGRIVPDWQIALPLAVRAASLTGLGYLGVDLMIDARKGPLLVEMNARPGLAIQLANGTGLVPRLREIDARATRRPAEERGDRIAFVCERFMANASFPGRTPPLLSLEDRPPTGRADRDAGPPAPDHPR